MNRESSINASSPADSGPFSRFILLAEDKNVKVEYDTYISDSSNQQIAVNLIFSNKLTDASLKNISFEVVDSVGLSVDTSAGIVVPVKFPEMLPKSNWNMSIFFTLKSDTPSPQTVRGSISYLKVDSAGNSIPEMKDFKMQFSSSSFLLPVQISSSEFALLLESGQLSASSNIQIEFSGVKFADIITRICSQGQFFLVEQAGESALLHAMSILQQRVALMVKFASGRVLVDLKSPEQMLTNQLLAEVIASLQGLR